MPNGGSDKQSPPEEVFLHGQTHPASPPLLEGPACQDRDLCRMALMVVAAGAVDVAVGEFFLGGIADFADGHVKVEMRSCERVVAVEGHFVIGDFFDGDDLRTLAAAGLELTADFEVRHAFDLRSRDDNDFLAVMFAITFLGRNIHLEGIAGDLAIKRLFQTRNDLAIAMDIRQGFVTIRRVDGLFFIVSESVVDEDDFAGSDLHEGLK